MSHGGQAMAEFAISVAVLALLLLGMPVIGRYHELQLATVEGARQLAFRNSWRQSGQSNADLGALRVALFPSLPNDGLPDVAQIDSRSEVSAAPGSAGQAARIWLAPFRFAAASRFDLHDRAFHGAELKVTTTAPAALPEPFAGSRLEFSGHYELLGDDWASSGPAQVAERTSGLLVARPASVLRPLLLFGKGLLMLVEPAIRDFCPGTVDPEQVPPDRLVPGPGNGAPPTGWRPAC
jgi:hypothetical protein